MIYLKPIDMFILSNSFFKSSLQVAILQNLRLCKQYPISSKWGKLAATCLYNSMINRQTKKDFIIRLVHISEIFTVFRHHTELLFPLYQSELVLSGHTNSSKYKVHWTQNVLATLTLQDKVNDSIHQLIYMISHLFKG